MISGISKEILVSDIYFEIGFEKISAWLFFLVSDWIISAFAFMTIIRSNKKQFLKKVVLPYRK